MFSSLWTINHTLGKCLEKFKIDVFFYTFPIRLKKIMCIFLVMLLSLTSISIVNFHSLVCCMCASQMENSGMLDCRSYQPRNKFDVCRSLHPHTIIYQPTHLKLQYAEYANLQGWRGRYVHRSNTKKVKQAKQEGMDKCFNRSSEGL